jgi:peptidoglycan/LPS O-acetylase OafA/YrhL
MFATIVAAHFLILYPPDHHDFGTAVVAQSTFVSNIAFMATDNYFDQPSRYSPLLHTWSLSVEEQFYVFFPLLIMLCAWLARRARSMRSILLAGVILFGIVSFGINVWFVNGIPGAVFKIPFIPDSIFQNTTYAMAGFYLIFTRTWELALGVLVALFAVKIRSVAVAEVLSFVGLSAVGVSLFLFNSETPFPGIAALLPTLGVVAIIIGNEHHRTKTAVLLSFPVLVWTGLISYSLYLWHWPLFVFVKLASTDPLSSGAMVGLIIVAIIIAVLSYRFIETPFLRKKTFITNRNTIFILGFGALALLVLSGFLIQRSTLLTGQLPPAARSVLLASAENVPWGTVCFQLPGDEERYGELCRIGDTNRAAKGQFVVWGDSHAEALVPLFNTLGRAYGAQGAVFDHALCVPVEGVHQTPPADGCEEEKAFALSYIRDYDIRQIILVARWSYYVRGGPRGLLSALISDSTTDSLSAPDAEKVFERNLTLMVEQLSREGREVTIVEQVPEQPAFNIRDAFYRAVHTGQALEMRGISTADHEAYQAPANSVIESLATLPGVRIADPATLLCKKGGRCDLENNGQFIYRDEDHISTVGAMSLEPLFTPVFKNMGLSNK